MKRGTRSMIIGGGSHTFPGSDLGDGLDKCMRCLVGAYFICIILIDLFDYIIKFNLYIYMLALLYKDYCT